ncbi:MAG: adenylosuccinate lyase [Clostridia bacterium]|nr:adenylosuccinate lyase [Clostridia bacterium]
MKEYYVNPLTERYASEEMKACFSPDNKFSTFRKLWIALAESEKALGLDITDEQIAEMKAHVYDIDYDKAAVYERSLRHDVMAHIRTYGDACPKAKPIIHLGATSCYVGDNTDIILMRQALLRVREMLVNVIRAIKDFAVANKDVYCLAYTHYQPAQPTTVGKRATLWLNDFIEDLKDVEYRLENLKLLGCKGTTGTSARFMALFDGDYEKVKKLESMIADKFGFSSCQPVSGQTYSRKVDYGVIAALSAIAQSASKLSGDIRLMSHEKEFDEPFEKDQVGSSAMAYKKNPMRSERIASLSRYVIVDALNPAVTAASQWLERTLDDSANRRVAIPEAFLAVDGVLTLVINVVKGGTVYPKMCRANLERELPFMATENILMYCVKKGGDRQTLHERIRVHSMETTKKIKTEGGSNDLLDRILSDKAFNITKKEMDALTSAKNFSGFAAEQTEDYIASVVDPLLEKYKDYGTVKTEVKV